MLLPRAQSPVWGWHILQVITCEEWLYLLLTQRVLWRVLVWGWDLSIPKNISLCADCAERQLRLFHA